MDEETTRETGGVELLRIAEGNLMVMVGPFFKAAGSR